MTHTPAHEAGAGLSPPLWQQLQACAKALRHVRQGRNHVQALAVVSPAMRPAAQALLFAVLRQWGCTLAVQKALVQRAPPAAVDDLLCIGLALALPANQAMYPMHTLVNQLVEAAKRDPSTRAQAAFINACVRRFDRERATWLKRCESQLSARWNHPDWWVKAVQQDHPMHWQAVLSASQQAAPMAVRVNRRQHSADALQALWQSQGVASDRCGPDGLVLQQPQAVHALPGFEQGWFSVQDPGAQMAAPLLLTGLQPSDGPRLRVLDACAAPGGKTAHLLELADVDLLAIDVEAAFATEGRSAVCRCGTSRRLVGRSILGCHFVGRTLHGLRHCAQTPRYTLAASADRHGNPGRHTKTLIAGAVAQPATRRPLVILHLFIVSCGRGVADSIVPCKQQ